MLQKFILFFSLFFFTGFHGYIATHTVKLFFAIVSVKLLSCMGEGLYLLIDCAVPSVFLFFLFFLGRRGVLFCQYGQHSL